MPDEMEELESLQASNHAFALQVEAQQKLLDALTTPNVSYFDMTPAEEIARLEAQVAAFQSTPEGGWFLAWETADKDRKALKAGIAELQAGRADLISTIEAMNEENAQLAHRLWCLENPE